MPDQKDAKRQLHDALTEAGALPHWELVATAQFLEQPATMRLRVDGGHLYVHGNAMTFAPRNVKDEEVLISEQNADEWFMKMNEAQAERDTARKQLAEMTVDRDRAQHGYEQEHLLRLRLAEELESMRVKLELSSASLKDAYASINAQGHKLYDALDQLGQEQRGREQAEARCEELRAERDAARDEMERRGAEWRHEIEALRRTNAELRRQVDDWEAEAYKYHQQARDLEVARSDARAERDEARREALELRESAQTISVGPDGMRLGTLEVPTCTGRVVVKVGSASFLMGGCQLANGHAGPCGARQQCSMATTDKWMRCKLDDGHEGACEPI